MQNKYIKRTGISIIGEPFVNLINTETGAVFPEATSNRDYVQYLEWLAEGNSPTVEEVPPPVCEVK